MGAYPTKSDAFYAERLREVADAAHARGATDAATDSFMAAAEVLMNTDLNPEDQHCDTIYYIAEGIRLLSARKPVPHVVLIAAALLTSYTARFSERDLGDVLVAALTPNTPSMP